jgi:hypothetical protein
VSEPSDLLRAVARSRSDRRGECPGEERILAFYRGLLDPAGEAAMREHLVLCARCRSLAGEARSFLVAMEEAPAGARPARRLGIAAAAVLVVAALGAWGWWISAARHPWREYARTAASYPLAESPDADLVFRGPIAEPALAEDLAPYLAGDYAESERRLAGRLRRTPQDLTAELYRGVCLLLLGRPGEAIAPLQRAAGSGDPAVGREARWYLALSRLENGDRAVAERGLRELAGSAGPRRAEAAMLLRRLGTG